MAVTVREVETLQRSFRGKALAHRPGAIRQLADGRYVVASATRPNIEYLVDLPAHTCTCPDYRRHGGPCKHLVAAEQTERASRPRQRIIVDEVTSDGRVLAWHEADTERQAKIAAGRKAIDELWPE